MSDEENILGGKLSIEDNYSSALSRFANSVLGAENKFKQFANNVIGSNNKIGSNLTKTQQDVDKFAQKFIQQGNSVADAINKANRIVEQNQERTIDGLTKKYLKLGMTIQDAYSKAQQESNHIWNGDSKTTGSNDGIKDFAQNLLSGGIGGAIGKLGLIGTGVMATVTALKKIDSAMDTGFGILNKASDGMFSYEGIKQALYESMDFELGRQQMNLFYGSDDKGLNAYQSATKVAIKSVGGVQDSINIMAKLGMAGATETTEDQLESLLDVAATKPNLNIDHIGFALQEAIYGRISSLSMNYGINNEKLIKYLDGLKKSDKEQYNRLKGALNKEGTANDPQKYVNLVTSYIKNSPMDGYAETYAKTTKGKLERLEDVWQQMKAEIMGINVGEGNKKTGGAFEAFDKMVDNLSNKLGEDKTKSAFETIAKGFGDGFASFGSAFAEVLEKTDWEKVGKAIADSIGVISDSLINLSESGALENLAENLPTIINTIINSKIIKTTSQAEATAEFAQGDVASGAWTYGMGWYDRFLNWTGQKDKNGNVIRSKEIQQDFYSEQSVAESWMNKMLHPFTDLTTDRDITNMIKNSSINDSQKEDLKKLISNDNMGSYNIHIEKIEANNFNEIMESIKQAQGNRRNNP